MTQQRSEAPRLRAKLARGGKGLGLAPTSMIFCVLAGAKTRKIRECIDIRIACRFAHPAKPAPKSARVFSPRFVPGLLFTPVPRCIDNWKKIW